MLQITNTKMPLIFFVLFLSGGLSLSLEAENSSSLNNRTVEWYNREDHENGTKSQFEGSNRARNLNLNKTTTDALRLSTTTQSTIDDGLNVTQKSNTFIVSRLLEYSALSWLKNEYVMSIVVPIAAGVGSGIVLIILINLWRCARAKCQRGCHKKNRNLPKHIKQMNLADRMKLLEESSDEEF